MGWAILGAAFGPQVILLLWWKRASYRGCVFGMLAGFIVPPLWLHLYEETGRASGVEVYNLPVGFVVALVVNVLVSWLSARRMAV